MTQKTNRGRTNARRQLLANALAVSAVVPTLWHWRKPVVESVLLPAHAQTSETPSTTLGSAGLFAAVVENRIPSGGVPEPAIAELSFVGCTAGPATFSAAANLSPSGSLNLGSITVANVVPGTVYTLTVAPAVVAPVAAVDTITTTASGAGGTASSTASPGDVASILMGSTLGGVCL